MRGRKVPWRSPHKSFTDPLMFFPPPRIFSLL
jgi:hypothetical protein